MFSNVSRTGMAEFRIPRHTGSKHLCIWRPFGHKTIFYENSVIRVETWNTWTYKEERYMTPWFCVKLAHFLWLMRVGPYTRNIMVNGILFGRFDVNKQILKRIVTNSDLLTEEIYLTIKCSLHHVYRYIHNSTVHWTSYYTAA